MTVPCGCCSSQALRKASATERDEDASPGNTDESMCSSVAMGFLQRAVSEAGNQGQGIRTRDS
jgi:hypothetical protein